MRKDSMSAVSSSPPWCSARVGPFIFGTRRQSNLRQPRGGAELRILAARVWRRSSRAGPNAQSRRLPISGGWRHTSGVLRRGGGKSLRRCHSALCGSVAGRGQEGPKTHSERLVARNDGTSEAGLDCGAGDCRSSNPGARHHGSHPAADLSSRHSQALFGEQARGVGRRHGISGLRREYERPLWLLMATTGLVLLIACAKPCQLVAGPRQRANGKSAVRLVMGLLRGR